VSSVHDDASAPGAEDGEADVPGAVGAAGSEVDVDSADSAASEDESAGNAEGSSTAESGENSSVVSDDDSASEEDAAFVEGSASDEDAASAPSAAEQEESSPVGGTQVEAAAVGHTPPDLTEDSALDSALEALLLVVDVPAGEELLADTLEQPVARISTALQRLSERYIADERGFDLRRVGDGWRFYTRETYAPYVERYLLDGQRSKLTRAALETLAVIAYRQPVTRSRVAAVRGVNVDGVIRTLVGRGLVEEAGTDPETGGYLYCTTELFLERLGLSSLKDLPPLAPLLPEVDTIDDV